MATKKAIKKTAAKATKKAMPAAKRQWRIPKRPTVQEMIARQGSDRMTAGSTLPAVNEAVETFEPVVKYGIEWRPYDKWVLFVGPSSSEADMRELLKLYLSTVKEGLTSYRLVRLITVKEVIE